MTLIRVKIVRDFYCPAWCAIKEDINFWILIMNDKNLDLFIKQFTPNYVKVYICRESLIQADTNF